MQASITQAEDLMSSIQLDSSPSSIRDPIVNATSLLPSTKVIACYDYDTDTYSIDDKNTRRIKDLFIDGELRENVIEKNPNLIICL